MCIGPNQKNQPNLDLYLVRRYIFGQILVMVSVSKYLKYIWYLYPYLKYISKVSVATLPFDMGTKVRSVCPLEQVHIT